MAQIGAVVMAAGSSRRFGSDKRLFDDGNGPLLQQTLSHVILLGIPVLVVLRSADQNSADKLLGPYLDAEQVAPFYAANSERGMGSNMSQIFASPPDWDGALIFLGDMAWISPDTSRFLMSAFNGEKVTVPSYEGQRGHPVLFPRKCFHQLSQLGGDTGGKALLAAQAENIIDLAVADGNILKDLDVP